jgi:hypothetical protein
MRRFALLILAVAIPSCRRSSGGSDAAPAPTVVVPVYAAGVAQGNMTSPDLTEASGIVAARKTPGVLWTHNDSGDGPYAYAMTTAGVHLAKYQLVGAGAIDWEDIAIGPGPAGGETYLYLGDIGANVPALNVTAYRVVEPVVVAAPGITALAGVDALPMTYPDGPHNAECLLVDPIIGDLFIVTKEATGLSKVFRNPAPHAAGVGVTLIEVATLDVSLFSGSLLVTGGDVSASGDLIALRTYSGAFMWARQSGTPLWTAFSVAATPVAAAAEPQGEAIGFAPDGSGYWTVSEGLGSPLYFYAKVP